jgi:competence protein ComEA
VRVLAITQKQADAIVAYRTKNGDFKDVDGIKKVDGVDAAAIDAKKDSIVF